MSVLMGCGCSHGLWLQARGVEAGSSRRVLCAGLGGNHMSALNMSADRTHGLAQGTKQVEQGCRALKALSARLVPGPA